MASAEDAPVQDNPDDKVRQVLTQVLNRRGYGAKSRLARDLGVRPQTVTKWLNGETSPPLDRWLHIEDALELERFALAKAAGLYESLGIGDRSESEAVESWALTFRSPRRPGAALKTGLKVGLGRHIDLLMPEVAKLPSSQLRMAVYDVRQRLIDQAAETLAQDIDERILPLLAAELAPLIRHAWDDALERGASTSPIDVDALIAKAEAAREAELRVEDLEDYALAAESGDTSEIDPTAEGQPRPGRAVSGYDPDAEG